MVSRLQFAVLSALAVLVAVLIAVNMYLFSTNRKLQNEINQRALFIQQNPQVETLSREIAVALAQLGVRSQDEQIRSLLASMGITVTVNPPAAPTAPAPATAARGAGK